MEQGRLAAAHALGEGGASMNELLPVGIYTIPEIASSKLLGVHVLGTNATEVVLIGLAVIGLGGTVDYLIDAAFNYPTLAEAYKMAALDPRDKLALERLSR